MNKKNIPGFHYSIVPQKTLIDFKNLILRILFFTVGIFLFISPAFSQPKTNLDIFYSLVDSSVNDFIKHIPQSEDSINLELNLGENYSIFNNKIIVSLYSSGKKNATGIGNRISINYLIDDVNVEYGEMFRDGFFGEYYIPRKLSLKGNYLIKDNPTFFNDFNFTFNDTIKFEDIKYVENESYFFTRGQLPSEPFFSGLFEPVVAVGTAALAVILFFTIRSK